MIIPVKYQYCEVFWDVELKKYFALIDIRNAPYEFEEKKNVQQ